MMGDDKLMLHQTNKEHGEYESLFHSMEQSSAHDITSASSVPAFRRKLRSLLILALVVF